jgi:hypothetical protein
MADLSIPAQAADWASSWIRDEVGPSVIRRNPGSARRRINAAIAELAADPVQFKRCAASIAALRALLDSEGE